MCSIFFNICIHLCLSGFTLMSSELLDTIKGKKQFFLSLFVACFSKDADVYKTLQMFLIFY